MAKHIANRFVRFVSYTDLAGNPVSDWHDEYMGLAGMLCIFESEHKAPGKRFVYFYPNEPDAFDQRYFNSIPGILSESGNTLVLEENHRYEFEEGEFISEDDKELLWLNVFMNIGT